MKKKMLNVYLCLLCFLIEFSAFCQDFPSDDEDGDLQSDDAAPVPINGKIIWLIIVAVLFGYYQFKKRQPQANSE